MPRFWDIREQLLCEARRAVIGLSANATERERESETSKSKGNIYIYIYRERERERERRTSPRRCKKTALLPRSGSLVVSSRRGSAHTTCVSRRLRPKID